jgi:soluble lytic murein transglycosylase-like protein
MRQNLKLATRIALVSGTVCMAASCSTTSRVYAVVPQQKPSAEEIAQIEQLQQVDTTALASAETTPLNLQPVDMATDRSVAMAYAIPQPKPVNNASVALQKAVEVASADPTAAQEAMANTLDANNDTASGLKTRSIQPIAMPDGFDQPDVSATNALLEQKPADQSSDPFVSSIKNTNLNQLISKYAALYDVPESLVHHVVRRETNYNPAAVHAGNWGLMQIRYNTAKGLGYDGSPTGLLDAETNLKYAVKYLKGAWIVADKDAKKADWLYRTGYYYQAKKKQLLEKLDMQ